MTGTVPGQTAIIAVEIVLAETSGRRIDLRAMIPGSALARDTKQRRAITATFSRAGRPLSPQEVLELSVSEVPGLGLATVYRTIKRLLDDGTITTVELPGQADRYEVAGKHHHHHFHCRGCGALYEVEGCPEDLGISLPSGFRLEDHEIILYGRCERCTAAG